MTDRKKPVQIFFVTDLENEVRIVSTITGGSGAYVGCGAMPSMVLSYSNLYKSNQGFASENPAADFHIPDKTNSSGNKFQNFF